jgi:hypothetical protein
MGALPSAPNRKSLLFNRSSASAYAPDHFWILMPADPELRSISYQNSSRSLLKCRVPDLSRQLASIPPHEICLDGLDRLQE